MVEMKIINTILIGLGNVGAKYDLKNNHRTSHIKSLSGIKKYNLNLVIDINKKNEDTSSSNPNEEKEISSNIGDDIEN